MTPTTTAAAAPVVPRPSSLNYSPSGYYTQPSYYGHHHHHQLPAAAADNPSHIFQAPAPLLTDPPSARSALRASMAQPATVPTAYEQPPPYQPPSRIPVRLEDAKCTRDYCESDSRLRLEILIRGAVVSERAGARIRERVYGSPAVRELLKEVEDEVAIIPVENYGGAVYLP